MYPGEHIYSRAYTEANRIRLEIIPLKSVSAISIVGANRTFPRLHVYHTQTYLLFQGIHISRSRISITSTDWVTFA